MTNDEKRALQSASGVVVSSGSPNAVYLNGPFSGSPAPSHCDKCSGGRKTMHCYCACHVSEQAIARAAEIAALVAQSVEQVPASSWDHDDCVQIRDQEIAKLEAENAGLRARLSTAEPSIHDMADLWDWLAEYEHFGECRTVDAVKQCIAALDKLVQHLVDELDDRSCCPEDNIIWISELLAAAAALGYKPSRAAKV